MHNYNVNCACFLPLYRKKSEIYLAVYSLIRTFANDGSLLAYSYLCKRSLARYSSVNAGVTFVGKTITALADYSVHLET